MLPLLVLFTGCGDDDGTNPPPPSNSWSVLGSGFNHAVRALTLYKGELIAGGIFSSAGDTTVDGIARWDGTAWHPLGQGTDLSGLDAAVLALLVYGDDLIAAGSFTKAGDAPAANVARWDGSAWHPLGAGVDASVLTMTTYLGSIAVGGMFTMAGDVEAGGLALWDGTAWSPIDSDVPESDHPVMVTALTIDGVALIAGGDFRSGAGISEGVVERWDGGQWTRLGDAANGAIAALTVWNGRLIAGGTFTKIGSTTVNGLASWDGTVWQPVGSGVSVNLEGFPYPGVAVLGVFEGDLMVGGFFRKAGDIWANCIARWDGSAWQATGGTDLPVLALTVLDDGLIVGGGFTWAGGIFVDRIARWGP
jgi:hypothetical protein